MTDAAQRRPAAKWYRRDAHLTVRSFAIANITLTLLWGKVEHYLINPVTGNLKVFAALLVMWVFLCPLALVVFVVVGLAQSTHRPEEEAKREQVSLYIDGVLVLAAHILVITFPHTYVTM